MDSSLIFQNYAARQWMDANVVMAMTSSSPSMLNSTLYLTQLCHDMLVQSALLRLLHVGCGGVSMK